MSGNLRLKIAIANRPHTAALKSGVIPIEGVDPEFVSVKPHIAAFRRMVRDLEFDVCEIAPTTYIIARAHNIPIIALPIFVVRRFHHSTLLVRPDANINHPKDLEGKSVGVRAYSVTTGVWSRCILMEEYGLDISKVNWVVDDEEHVRELKLPSNVTRAPKGGSLADMMASGELAAGYHANAGIGRTGDPTGGWKTVEANYPKLFPNFEELETDYFNRTGIYPMHGTIVIKEEILKKNPEVAKSIYDAFVAAKAEWLSGLATAEDDKVSGLNYNKLQKIVGADPLPYGIENNRKTIEALERTAFEQKLLPRRMSVEDLFIDPSKF